MIARATQRTRQLAVSDLLGPDVLLLTKIEGSEELSRLFHYELEIDSEEANLDPRQIVGRNVTVRIDYDGRDVRYLNGFVSEFRHCGWSEHFSHYRATVVPWLWFLTQTTDCRIFQRRSTPEIIEQVFSELGFSDFEIELKRGYPQREYCVQYRETDYNFVTRLLEEEGIFYYCRHENGRHTLVLADHGSAYYDLADFEVDFPLPGRQVGIVDQIKSWEHVYAFHPGGCAQRDFNFKTPSNNLHVVEPTVRTVGNNQNFELYDYHGRHSDTATGQQLARTRIEEQEAKFEQVRGECTYRSFSPGGRFQVRSHRVAAAEKNKYVVKRTELTASIAGDYVTGSEAEEEYRCRFVCLPEQTAFRPERIARRPIVEGPQTAVVVGPPGEEIYPDEFGRVKCQFHWDREGAFDEESSCWIRVSQAHAGSGWGGIDLPRIGEEVIVDFLEGDPDAPIITGRVYNARNMPPFALPAEKTRSGMKSNTHKGSGYNEISFDDTAGKEQLRTNAQYNMDTSVGNNQTLVVGVDRSAEIGNNDATTVGNDQTESVGNNKKVTVGNNKNVNVGNKMVVNAGTSITLKCGASKIHMNSGGVINITGTIITTAAAANASVVAPMTQVVGGAMLTTVGGLNIMSGGVTQVLGGLASVAGGKVDLAATGTTAIKGGTITLN